MSDWQPIESFPGDHPYGTSEGAPGIRYYEDALVYGPVWEGGWSQSPYEPQNGGGFIGDKIVAIASTYTGKGFWALAQNYGPGDYDQWIQPTHWMPLPEPPK